MEKNLVTQSEIRLILKSQDSVNVVLNNGSYQLDDATIPFQIGFSSKIAKQKPTHVMVVDVTEDAIDSGERKDRDTVSERQLFSLEPVNYLQLKKSGEHHLIFILFNSFPQTTYEVLFSKRFSYEKALSWSSIEKNDFWYQVGYCEKIVAVPKELFAEKPKTAWSKAIWSWVNSWHKLAPVDECEYRNRKIFAFTIKPILWLLGFFVRLLIAPVSQILSFILRVFALIFGYQPVKFFPHLKEVWWDFLFRYSQSSLKIPEIFDFLGYWVGTPVEEKYWDGADEEDFHCYKEHSVFGKKFHAPLTIFGMIFYVTMIFGFLILLATLFSFKDVRFLTSVGGLIFLLFVSLATSLLLGVNTIPSLKGGEAWKWKWDKQRDENKNKQSNLFLKLFFILGGFSVFAFLVSTIWRVYLYIINSPSFSAPALSPLSFIASACLLIAVFLMVVRPSSSKESYFSSVLKRCKTKISDKRKITRTSKEEKRATWLKTSFNLKAMPKKVDVAKAPEPSVFVHRFVIKFWQTKAKVCRPYAKN